MKIWNTKYVFTDGILEQEAEVYKTNEGMVLVGKYMYLHGEGKEWHRSKESAVRRAEEMRDKKIKSLEKQLKRIKALVF